MPDWLRAMQPGEAAPLTPAAFTPETPLAAEETPAWLSAAGSAEPAPPAAPTFDLGVGESEEPDWLRSVRDETPPVPSKPGTAPFVSAFAEPEVEPPAEAEVPMGTMPDWLASIQPADMTTIPTSPMPEPETLPEATPPVFGQALGADGLAQAALPSWLQAMRPVEVQQPAVQAVTDTYEETVGVLAGMRGVLQAEPTVALPRKSTVQVHRLEVSQAEAALADLISGMVSDERLAYSTAKRRVQWTPLVERLSVAAVMLVAILIAYFASYFVPGLELFPLPTSVSAEVEATFNLIEALPTDRPALVAFDYEPGQTGELDPAAMALVTHLLRRGISVVGVSTRPTGPGVAEAVLGQTTDYLEETLHITATYGTDYLNLGYIPGGPAGLVQFASDPRLLFRTDFRGTTDVWQQPILGAVKDDAADNIGTDFGVIVLVEAAPDTARAWIEQTRGILGDTDTPLVAVVSAGADPLIRPYYVGSGSAHAPLRGFVSGAVGATEYQFRAGLFANDNLHVDAQGRWDVLGGGLLMAALILVVGAVVQIAQRAMRTGKTSS
jgi:hypothetical protein